MEANIPKQPLEYNAALIRGRKLLSMMSDKSCTGRAAGATNFTLEDLSKWGYRTQGRVGGPLLDSYNDFLTSLGTNSKLRQKLDESEDGDNVEMIFMHHETKGYFRSILNRKVGMLIAFSNVGPKHNLARRLGRGEKVEGIVLPELRHWSDVAFLQWKTLSAQDVSDSPLRYVLQAGIMNRDTIAVMSKILGEYAGSRQARPYLYETELPSSCGTPPPQWPGITYQIDTDEAQALLGTPNGLGVGWLLAQHKDDSELGHKIVDEVTLFFSAIYAEDQPNLLFHIKDAE